MRGSVDRGTRRLLFDRESCRSEILMQCAPPRERGRFICVCEGKRERVGSERERERA